VSNYQESEILKDVSRGNEKAFQELFNEWQPRLSAFLFKISKSKETTEEIVSDVFLKIWLSRENLAQISNFRAYLFTACKNQAINALKKNLNELKHLKNIERKNLNNDFISPFEESIDDKFPLIDAALNTLPERQRQVYILSRFDHLTYDEIAKKLGIGKESVKTHMKLATASISNYLKGRIHTLILIIGYFSEKM
jgi:RNA polymerase sigma-70 factor (ECF subfamily)